MHNCFVLNNKGFWSLYKLLGQIIVCLIPKIIEDFERFCHRVQGRDIKLTLFLQSDLKPAIHEV